MPIRIEQLHIEIQSMSYFNPWDFDRLNAVSQVLRNVELSLKNVRILAIHLFGFDIIGQLPLIFDDDPSGFRSSGVLRIVNRHLLCFDKFCSNMPDFQGLEKRDYSKIDSDGCTKYYAFRRCA